MCIAYIFWYEFMEYRYVWNLEELNVLSVNQPCLNTMFKQVASEPWTANWRRWRSMRKYKLEHLVLLSFNTSYME